MDDELVPLWTALRQHLQSYFGDGVLQVEDTVLAAFERTDDDSDLQLAANSDSLLASALRSQPSLAPGFEAVGVDVPSLVESLPDASRAFPSFLYEWDGILGLDDTLDVCFTNMRPRSFGQGVRNIAAQNVLRRGVLRLDDLILGALESRTLDDGEDQLTSSSNQITGALLAAAGKASVSPWSPEAADMFEKLPTIFESLRVEEPALGSEHLLLYVGPKGEVRVVRQAFYSSSILGDRRGSTFAITASSPHDQTLEELEWLINQNRPEQAFQEFFGRNPRFLLTLQSGWLAARPHVVLHMDEAVGDLIPDFVMERIDGLADLVELKRPDTRIVVRQRGRDRLSAAISEAVAQLRSYSEVLSSEIVKDRFRQRGVDGYRPRMVVIAGRSASFRDGLDRQILTSLLPPHVELQTFDDVVDRARLWLPRLLDA